MKTLLTFCLVLSACLSVAAQNAPTIKFDTKFHDFGDIKESDKTATCTFSYTNTGKAPLIIHRAVASCGCTTPEFTEAPVLPGEKGSVIVTYNTVGRPFAFQKTITVYTNDPDNQSVILSIKGNVESGGDNVELSYPFDMDGLRLNKKQVSFLDARIGRILTDKIDLINTTGSPMKLSLKNVPAHMKVVASKTVLKPKEKASLSITFLTSKVKDYGRRQDQFEIVFNNQTKTNEGHLITVNAYLTEDFSALTTEQLKQAPSLVVNNNRVNLGKMKQNEVKTANITLTNYGKTPLYLRKIVPEYDGLTLKPEKTIVQPGQSIKVSLSFNAGKYSGNVVQRATIFNNDPKNSLTRIFISATVEPVQK
jgi:hypothetical protein